MQKTATGEVCGTAVDRIKADFVGLWEAAMFLLGTGQYGLFPTQIVSPSRKSWKQAGKCLG